MKTFWVTSSVPCTMSDLMTSIGVLFRGNLRSNNSPAEVFTELTAALQNEFGDKYVLYMLPERSETRGQEVGY